MVPQTRLHTRHRSLPRFLVIGGLATLAHWGVMAQLLHLGASPYLATGWGALTGLALNYLGQHRLAFRSTLRHRVALPRYLAAAGTGWLLNLGAFAAALAILDTVALAQVLATGGVALINYLIADGFVFHEQSSQDLP